MNGLSYSRFMNGLSLMGSTLNRKMLADLAVSDFEAFSALADAAKKALADNGQVVREASAATSEKGVKINAAAPKAAKKVASSEKPSDKNTVAEIKAYLSANGIDFPASAKKAELLALV